MVHTFDVAISTIQRDRTRQLFLRQQGVVTKRRRDGSAVHDSDHGSETDHEDGKATGNNDDYETDITSNDGGVSGEEQVLKIVTTKEKTVEEEEPQGYYKGPEFPHADYSRKAKQDDDDGDDAEETDDERNHDAGLGGHEKRRNLKAQHLNVLNAILHKSLQDQDFVRAHHAFSLLLRFRVNSRRVDLRKRGLWGIGAELLLRCPPEDASASTSPPSASSPLASPTSSQSPPWSLHSPPRPSSAGPRESVEDDDSAAEIGAEARTGHNPPPLLDVSRESQRRLQNYYERLVLQYPYLKFRPRAVDNRNFYPAMFGLWIMQAQGRTQSRLRRLEPATRKHPHPDRSQQGGAESDQRRRSNGERPMGQASGNGDDDDDIDDQGEQPDSQDEDDGDTEMSDNNGDADQTHPSDRRDNRRERLRHRLYEAEMREAIAIEERMDTFIHLPPFDENVPLLQLRSDVALWHANLLLSLPKQRVGGPAAVRDKLAELYAKALHHLQHAREGKGLDNRTVADLDRALGVVRRAAAASIPVSPGAHNAPAGYGLDGVDGSDGNEEKAGIESSPAQPDSDVDMDMDVGKETDDDDDDDNGSAGGSDMEGVDGSGEDF